MALESGTYISDLVPSNPAGTDDRSQGDDHIRLIKSTLKNTFPNVNGAVSATDEQLSALSGAGVLAFPGMIVMWSGTVATIPSGWKLCDGVGTISTGAPVPNLVGRFIVGSATDAGSAYDIGDTGGLPQHTHAVTIQGHALTIDQMPSHTHNIAGGNAGSFGSLADMDGGPAGTIVTQATGGGQPHSHGVTVDTVSNLPPFYALAFLIKN